MNKLCRSAVAMHETVWYIQDVEDALSHPAVAFVYDDGEHLAICARNATNNNTEGRRSHTKYGDA